jgi:hypothetical protein
MDDAMTTPNPPTDQPVRRYRVFSTTPNEAVIASEVSAVESPDGVMCYWSDVERHISTTHRQLEEARKSEARWKRDAWDTIVAMARACGLPEAQDPMVAPDDYVLPPEWEGKMSDTMRKIVAERNQALAALAQARKGWVACSERMPANESTVLIKANGWHRPYAAYYSEKKGKWFQDSDWCGAESVIDSHINNNVSHWMKMPDLPDLPDIPDLTPPPTAQNGGAV